MPEPPEPDDDSDPDDAPDEEVAEPVVSPGPTSSIPPKSPLRFSAVDIFNSPVRGKRDSVQYPDSIRSEGSFGLIHSDERHELERQLNTPAWTISPGYLVKSVTEQVGEGTVTTEHRTILQHMRQSPTITPKTALLGGRGDIALGIPILRSGQRAISIDFGMQPAAGSAIAAASGGGDVYIGLADAQADHADQEPGRAWGVRVRTGDVHVTPSAHHAGYRGRSLLPSSLVPDSFRSSKLQLKAAPCSVAPTRVVMLIDMDTHAVAFSINGQVRVPA